MRTRVIHIVTLLLAFLPAFFLKAQHKVLGFEKVTGTQTLHWGNFTVAPGGHFINSGRVNFEKVTTLTNNGGISEISNGQQQAAYSNPCNDLIAGTSGLNVFGGQVSLTTINGNAPVRMYSVLLDRHVRLENEWQIVHSLNFYNGLVITDRSNPDHFLHILAGGGITGADPARHINGYAAYSGEGSFTLPIGDGQKLGLARISGNCQEPVKAAYFSVNPNVAVLPSGAPFNTAALDSGLTNISAREYWDINGTGETAITLFFDSSSALAELAQSLAQIVIAGWDGNKWVNLGNADFSGTLGGGSVTSLPLVPDDYEAYTFASSCSVILSSAPGTDHQVLCLNDPLLPVEFSTTGAFGISGEGITGANGLPEGVVAVWENNKIRISGNPVQSGIFLFNIPLMGCSGLSASGSINVRELPSPGNLSGDQEICTGSLAFFASSVPGGIWTSSNDTVASVHPVTGVVSGLSAGTATISYTVIGADSCTAFAALTVMVTDPPMAATIAGDSLICAGNTGGVSANQPGGYWGSTNSAVASVDSLGRVTGLSQGTALITYTFNGSGGCTDVTSTFRVTVSAPPVPGITFASEDSILTCSTPNLRLVASGGTTYTWSSGLGLNDTVSVTAPGIYSVIVTSVVGCSDQASITINQDTVRPLADIVNLTGNNVLTCSRTSILLRAIGGVSYLWSTSATSDSIAVTTPGTYTVTVTGTNGCTETASITITQDTTPLQAAITNLTGSSVLTCTRTSIWLRATGGVSYLWSTNASSDSIAVFSPGTYTVTVTGANGCTQTASIAITQDTILPQAAISNLTGDSALRSKQSRVEKECTDNCR